MQTLESLMKVVKDNQCEIVEPGIQHYYANQTLFEKDLWRSDALELDLNALLGEPFSNDIDVVFAIKSASSDYIFAYVYCDCEEDKVIFKLQDENYLGYALLLLSYTLLSLQNKLKDELPRITISTVSPALNKKLGECELKYTHEMSGYDIHLNDQNTISSVIGEVELFFYFSQGGMAQAPVAFQQSDYMRLLEPIVISEPSLDHLLSLADVDLILPSIKSSKIFNELFNADSDKPVIQHTEALKEALLHLVQNTMNKDSLERIFALRSRVNQDIIGMIWVCKDEGEACIGAFAVDEKYQRRGYGSILLAYALKHFQQHDIKNCNVDAYPVSFKSYIKMGFSLREEYPVIDPGTRRISRQVNINIDDWHALSAEQKHDLLIPDGQDMKNSCVARFKFDFEHKFAVKVFESRVKELSEIFLANNKKKNKLKSFSDETLASLVSNVNPPQGVKPPKGTVAKKQRKH